MAITLIVEDGTIVTDANTYVDSAGAFATAYFEAHLNKAAWTAATDEQKKAAVVQATRTIDSLIRWQGRRVEEDQPREWPRQGVRQDNWLIADDVVPKRVQEATLEQALAMLGQDRLSDAARDAPVTEIGLGQGAMAIKFGADPKTDLPPISEIVRLLLEPFGSTKGGAMVRIARA